MGSYSGLYFDHLEVAWEKNAAPAFCPVLFTPNQFFNRPRSKAHRDVSGCLGAQWYDSNTTRNFYYYRAPVATVWLRLSVHGYSERRVQEGWEQARISTIADSVDDHPTYTESRRVLLKGLTFEKWCAAYRTKHLAAGLGQHDNSAETYLLLNSIYFDDPLLELAAKLYACDPKVVWADVTDIYHGGYADHDLTPHDELNSAKTKLDHAFEKILILTEGQLDKAIISKSLSLFYPELSDIYTFVEFEGFRVEGGASPLARLIKAFAGAGLTNRVIAVFDNDAAGHEALGSLKSIKLPSTFKVIALPDIEMAREYPTLGPTGEHYTDINGRACAIELYLGRHSLEIEGKLIPVTWSDWNKGSARYHGKLENKSAASDKYLSDLKANKSPAALRKRYPEMNFLLISLFSAFS